MNGKHVNITAVCVSLRWSGGLRVVQLPAGSWLGPPRWQRGLCMKCVVSSGSTSFLWLVFFYGVLLWRIHDSKAYRKMDNGCDKGAHQWYIGTERNTPFIPNWFQSVNAAIVCAILESIPGLKTSSLLTQPTYLKLVTV